MKFADIALFLFLSCTLRLSEMIHKSDAHWQATCLTASDAHAICEIMINHGQSSRTDLQRLKGAQLPADHLSKLRVCLNLGLSFCIQFI